MNEHFYPIFIKDENMVTECSFFTFSSSLADVASGIYVNTPADIVMSSFTISSEGGGEPHENRDSYIQSFHFCSHFHMLHRTFSFVRQRMDAEGTDELSLME